MTRHGWKLCLLALLCLSCARASKEAPAESPAPEQSPQGQPLSEIDAYQHDLEVSEARLRTVLAERSTEISEQRDEQRGALPEPPPPAQAPAPERPRASQPAPSPAPGAAPAPAEDADATAPVRVGSDCDLACRALASMRRAAEGICGITGEADERCRDAKARVVAAELRIEGAGCKCQ